MPPPATIQGLDPRFFRPCIFPVLRRLGYDTRVTINNGLGAGSPFAVSMRLSMSVFDQDGALAGSIDDLGRLEPGEITKIDTAPLLAAQPNVPEGNLLGVIHAVPEHAAGEQAIDVSTSELMAHVRSSDDFIEFHQRDGEIVTGVAYQTGPLNDSRLSSTRTTVLQAPKVIVSEPVDTLFTLLNVSTSFDYADPVTMNFWVLRPDGTRVTRASVTVPAWSFRQVSVTDVLAEAGELETFREHGGVGMFLGYAANGTVVPLSLTRNKTSGAIACDHTLPPIFYVSTWGGPVRLEANARLAREFFPDVAEPAPGPMPARVGAS